MLPRMKSWLIVVARRIQRLLKPPAAAVDRSRLMGMYLTQANKPAHTRVRVPVQEVRQRQNGKFSQIRRRG